MEVAVGPNVNYGDMYERREPSRTTYGAKSRSSTGRVRQNFDDFVFGSRGEADLVLDGLLELIDVYGQAKLADFYDLIDEDSSSIDF